MEDGGLPQSGPLPNTHLKSCVKVGRPTLESHKGPVVGRHTVEDPLEPRACEGCREEIWGCPNEADLGLQQALSPLTPKTRRLTDEALMEEASRYIGSLSRPFFSLGKRVLSSSSSLSGLDGLFDATEGGGGLRSVGLANERTEEGTEVVLDRAPQEMMEKGDEGGGLSWQSSCLVKFSRCLGMPTEGFEGEILFLLKE
ncbi:hypothetical protein CK203_113756 [Vitis vinifera]|uniref:Uncharacterized protein n=1 Tax=Vitis vinifera TaxID=29760 RepID=A0A438CPG9_VITVI|nr:hypothetical protein CK203_113756 [Vitis vinifera]